MLGNRVTSTASRAASARAPPGQRTAPHRLGPIRTRKLATERLDPEETALHVLHYPPPQWAGDDEQHQSSSSWASLPSPPLPAAYHPMADGGFIIGPSSQPQDNDVQPRAAPWRNSSAYVLPSITGRAGKPTLIRHPAPTVRQLVGVGPSFADDFFRGPDYRYSVDDHGQVLDMVQLKQQRIPEAFHRAVTSRPPFPTGAIPGDAIRSGPGSSGNSHVSAGAAVAQRHKAGSAPDVLDDLTSQLPALTMAPLDLPPATALVAPRADQPTTLAPAGPSPATPPPPSSNQNASGGRFLAVPPPTPGSVPFQTIQQQAALVLRVYPYSIGRNRLFQGLWELDLVEQVTITLDLDAADVVLHRKPEPGEKQFAYNRLRASAKERGIPFVSVADGSAEELRRYLLPVFSLYRGELTTEEVVRLGSLGKAKRIRL